MAIQVRGTADGSDTSGSGFSLAPPSGVQVGDLLLALKQEDAEPANIAGWTNISPSSPAIFDNFEDALCAHRYHDGSSTYAVSAPGGGIVTVSMIALYSDIGGTLVVDEATCALTEVEASGLSNVTWNLQGVTTAEDDSLLVALIGLIAADETPATPAGGVTVETSGADAGIDSGGFKIVTEARATAGATGVRFIETLRAGGGSNAGNAVAGAFAVSETPPPEVGDGDIDGTGELAAAATSTQSGSAAIVGTGEVAGTAVALQEGFAAIVGTGEVATFPDPTVILACPIVTNISPLELGQTMAAAKKAPVTLDLEMVPADLEPLVVMSIGEDSYWPFVAVRGEEFAPYLDRDSEVTRLGDTYSLSLLPNGGWLKAPSVIVGGFEEDETPASIYPVPGGALAATRADARWTPISFDLTPEVYRVPFIYVKFAEFSALPLVIFGGEGFAPMFADSSKVSEVGGVFSFSILPIGGWRDDPTIIAGDFLEAC